MQAHGTKQNDNTLTSHSANATSQFGKPPFKQAQPSTSAKTGLMNQACLYKNPNFVPPMQVGGGYDPDMGVMVNHIANASTP